MDEMMKTLKDMASLPRQVPNPEEVDALLKGDFGVDEAAPEKALEVCDRTDDKVLEVGDRTNYDNPVSVMSDIADTYFDTSISIELAEEIIEDLEAMGWRLTKFSSTGGNSKVLEVGDRESEVMEVGDLTGGKSTIDADRDIGYRKSVRAMHDEYTRQFNEIEKLIVNLYLDLQYISRINRNAWQLIADHEPDKARFLLDMIDSQAIASIRSIEYNSQTPRLPQSLIHNHESSTT